MTIEELCEWYYEDLDGYIDAIIRERAGSLTLLFSAKESPETQVRRYLELGCDEVLACSMCVSSEYVESLAIYEDHPLLEAYCSRRAQLNYVSPPEDPFAVWGRLHKAQQDFLDPRFLLNMPSFINEKCNLRKPAGVVATGPLELLETFAEAVEPVLSTTISNCGDEREGPKHLVLIVDDQFVVARSFSVAQVQDDQYALWRRLIRR
ncbi:hypothetical protein KQI84_06365 [bacterium]|nr:hypothetical protein [bacterium]